MSNQIKNIVFDLGGVLVGLDEGRCIQAFDQLGCQQVSHYVNQRLAQGLFHDLEIGNISTRQFCDEVRRMTESNVSDNDIMKTWNLMLVSMPDYKKEKLMELRGKYRLSRRDTFCGRLAREHRVGRADRYARIVEQAS